MLAVAPAWGQTATRMLVQLPPTNVPAVVSVWYRGTPAGTPRDQDLADIRARGFECVTWPSRETAGADALYRLAAAHNLRVTLRIAPMALTPASARTPEEAVDIKVASIKPELYSAFVWRAVAHGARVVSFDAGDATGSGFESNGNPRPWVAAAANVAGQLAAQARLLEEWRPMDRLATVDGASADDLDLALLNDNRSWTLVVTNTSASRVRAVAHLPAGLPSALWVNLLDGSLLSIINEPAGPRWSLELDGGTARVYVVNKTRIAGFGIPNPPIPQSPIQVVH